MKNQILATMMMLGMVEHVFESEILISYERGSRTFHSRVSKDLSACLPEAGQKVYFIKDYKVVQCNVEGL